MCIEKLSGGYVPMCDLCYDTLDREEDWYAAKDAMKEAGWKQVKIDGTWFDVCPECQQYDEAADGE